jgi:hypothetical protein
MMGWRDECPFRVICVGSGAPIADSRTRAAFSPPGNDRLLEQSSSSRPSILIKKLDRGVIGRMQVIQPCLIG